MTAERVTLSLNLTNRSDTAMPSGLGFHPYFPRDTDTSLRMVTGPVWLADATQLPARPAAPDHFLDWSDGAAVADAPFIDNAYEGWPGSAVIRHAGRTLMLPRREHPRFTSMSPKGQHSFAWSRSLTYPMLSTAACRWRCTTPEKA